MLQLWLVVILIGLLLAGENALVKYWPFRKSSIVCRIVVLMVQKPP